MLGAFNGHWAKPAPEISLVFLGTFIYYARITLLNSFKAKDTSQRN